MGMDNGNYRLILLFEESLHFPDLSYYNICLWTNLSKLLLNEFFFKE